MTRRQSLFYLEYSKSNLKNQILSSTIIQALFFLKYLLIPSKIAFLLLRNLSIPLIINYKQSQQQQPNSFQMSEPRKSNKSDINNRIQRVSTTCLHTPPKSANHQYEEELKVSEQKQCPYHFSQPTHICLSCRKSICLRCAITYCQQHTIHPQQQILPLLLIDLQKLTIQPRIDDIDLKLKQSLEHEQHFTTKISKIFQQIQNNFTCLKMMLERKKQQILQYYQEQLMNRYTNEFKKYNEELYEQQKWLHDIIENIESCQSIEEIDQLATLIKKQIAPQSKNKESIIYRYITGKQKLKIQKIWSQEKLEKVLYEIENIGYKLKDSSSIVVNSTTKKKRMTTEASEVHKKVSPFSINSQSPFANIMRSTSNSRFPTGRKIQS